MTVFLESNSSMEVAKASWLVGITRRTGCFCGRSGLQTSSLDRH